MSTAVRSASNSDRATRRRGDAATRRRGDAAKMEAPQRLIEVINRQRLRPINRDKVAGLSREVLDRIGREESTLTITFIRDRAMRRLNREYRGIDKATDVLSFAYHEGMEMLEPETETDHLGDVVISVETAAAYARKLNLTFNREIEYLVIHGTLHLAGYDHETDNGEMKRIERRLRRELLERC